MSPRNSGLNLAVRTKASGPGIRKSRTCSTSPRREVMRLNADLLDVSHESNIILLQTPGNCVPTTTAWNDAMSGMSMSYQYPDSTYMPTTSIAPRQLTAPEPMDYPFLPNTYDGFSTMDTLYTGANYEPTMEQDAYSYAPRSLGLPLSPPLDFPYDDFEAGGSVPMFEPLPQAFQQCELIPARQHQPRPILSISDRTGMPPSPPDSLGQIERVQNKYRTHPDYSRKPDKDGWYRCPDTIPNCGHERTKQKCIYAKNLDSHHKPYKCTKFADIQSECIGIRFSSNACLFRHEREMHGLHNHGMNPYLCKFDHCERSRPDNGFPRRWNQRDHMRRVHGYETAGDDDDSPVELGYTGASGSSSRKRGPSGASRPTGNHCAEMKKSTSNRGQNGRGGARARSSTGPKYPLVSTQYNHMDAMDYAHGYTRMNSGYGVPVY